MQYSAHELFCTSSSVEQQYAADLACYVEEQTDHVQSVQCRQKTVEVKAKCSSCTMYFCPRCLLNRYGEEVDKVSLSDAVPKQVDCLPNFQTPPDNGTR